MKAGFLSVLFTAVAPVPITGGDKFKYLLTETSTLRWNLKSQAEVLACNTVVLQL